MRKWWLLPYMFSFLLFGIACSSDNSTYTLTIQTTAGGIIVEPETTSMTTELGVEIIISAMPEYGYRFVNWTVVSGTAAMTNSNESETTIILTRGNATVQANFVLESNQSTLTVIASIGGSIVLPASGNITETLNTDIQIQAIAESNYEFSTWTVVTGNVVFEDVNSNTTMVRLTDGDATIRANFVSLTETATLTVQAGAGGTIVQPAGGTETAALGSSITIVASAITDYSFVEWTVVTGDASINDVYSASTSVQLYSGDATIQANFQADTGLSTLTVQTTTGGTVVLPSGGTQTTALHVGIPVSVAPQTGYIFTMWEVVSGSVDISNYLSSQTTMELTSGDAVVRANFELITYSLIILNSSGGSIITPQDILVSVQHGVPIELQAQTNSGYQFDGWSADKGTVAFNDASSLHTTVTLTDGDATILASFSEMEYMLTVQASTGGTIVTPFIGYVVKNMNDVVSIRATADTGYIFTGWTLESGQAEIGNAGSLSTTVTMGTEDATVQANFIISTYQLTVASGTGGSIVDPVTTPITVAYNEETTIEATAASGYAFSNWTTSNDGVYIGDSSAASTSVRLTTENATITANFLPSSVLTVVAGVGGSISTPTEMVTTVFENQAVTIAAIADSYFGFDGWSLVSGTGAVIDNDSAASTTITLGSDDVTIQANFVVTHDYALSFYFGNEPGVFRFPVGVDVDELGNIYVADAGNDRVQKFSSDYSFITKWGYGGSGNGEFSGMSDIAVSSDGSGGFYVYIADKYNDRVQHFDGDGIFLRHFGSEISDHWTEMASPNGLCTDHDGYLYVTDNGTLGGEFGDKYRAVKFMYDGGVFIGLRWGFAMGYSGPFEQIQDVAVDTNGYVYIIDQQNESIHKYQRNTSDENLNQIAGGSGTGNGQFQHIKSIVADEESDGTIYLYVVDTNNHRIQKLAADGSYVSQWGVYGTDEGQFGLPEHIAADGNGHIFVADYTRCVIHKFDTSGNFISTLGRSYDVNGQFYNPRGVAVDSQGNIFVADTDNHRIQKFDSTGRFITKWGSYGTNDNQFRYTRGLCFDQDDNLYITDRSNHRIQKYTSTGVYLDTIGISGTSGSADGYLNFPEDVAVDSSGNIYVADYYNDRIQKFDNTGAYDTQWYSNNPIGVAVDEHVDGQTEIYTGEYTTTNNVSGIIRKYHTDGTLLQVWGENVIGTTEPGEFNIVNSIHVDQSGYVYVSDDSRIQKFDSEGTFLSVIGNGEGAEDGQLLEPTGIATVDTSTIIVADRDNNRIQIFVRY